MYVSEECICITVPSITFSHFQHKSNFVVVVVASVAIAVAVIVGVSLVQLNGCWKPIERFSFMTQSYMCMEASLWNRSKNKECERIKRVKRKKKPPTMMTTKMPTLRIEPNRRFTTSNQISMIIELFGIVISFLWLGGNCGNTASLSRERIYMN